MDCRRALDDEAGVMLPAQAHGHPFGEWGSSSVNNQQMIMETPAEHQNDPQLDNFMVSALGCLTELRQDLYKAHREAKKALSSRLEGQLQSLLSLTLPGPKGCSEERRGDGEEASLQEALTQRYQERLEELQSELAQRRKAPRLAAQDVDVLKAWYHANMDWPYPDDEQKRAFVQMTSLTTQQITDWFINQRKRHWHKLFDGNLPRSADEARRRLQTASRH